MFALPNEGGTDRLKKRANGEATSESEKTDAGKVDTQPVMMKNRINLARMWGYWGSRGETVSQVGTIAEKGDSKSPQLQ